MFGVQLKLAVPLMIGTAALIAAPLTVKPTVPRVLDGTSEAVKTIGVFSLKLGGTAIEMGLPLAEAINAS